MDDLAQSNIKIEETDEYLSVNDQKIYVSKDLQSYILAEYKEKETESSISQFASIMNLPGIIKAIGLPDFHSGYALPIGSIAVIDLDHPDASISPDGIGFDINCGVRCLKTNLTIEDLTCEVRNLIGDEIIKDMPFGDLPADKQIANADIDRILNVGMKYLLEKGLCTADDIEKTESGGSLPGNSRLISQKPKSRGRQQLGTLGCGNHYLEFEVVDQIVDKEASDLLGIKKGQIIISIHTGSRGLGHCCCTDIMTEIENFKEKDTISSHYNQLKEKFSEVSKDESLTKEDKLKAYKKIKEDLKAESKKARNTPKKSKELLTSVSISSEIGQKYISIMNSAANFAWANRSMITYKVRNVLSRIFPHVKVEMISDICHNIGKIESLDDKKVLVLRKGASRILPPNHPELPAPYKDIGLPILIGGSMGTSSFLIRGDSFCKETFFSTCHGAGRLISRKQSKVKFKPEDVLKEMEDKGIVLKIGATEGAVEECSDCYKDVNEVVNHSQKLGISKNICKVKPILVIKG